MSEDATANNIRNKTWTGRCRILINEMQLRTFARSNTSPINRKVIERH